jgi:hypothetical protein
LAIGTVMPTSALGLTQVTLNCDDGTTWTAVVDTDTLSSLLASVQGMLDFPAGLSCTLVQVPVVRFGDPALAAPGTSAFVVAGGRWQVKCSEIFGGLPIPFLGGGTVARAPGAWYSLAAPASTWQQTDPGDVLIWVNIAVNVHMRDDGSFFGTLNETIPGNQVCGTTAVGESHFTSRPLCLLTTGPGVTDPVFVKSQVTQVSGQVQFLTPGGAVNANDFLHFGFQDNGNPPGQNPSGVPTTDMLAGPPATPEGSPTTGCNTDEWPPVHNLGLADGSKQFGNISVHP